MLRKVAFTISSFVFINVAVYFLYVIFDIPHNINIRIGLLIGLITGIVFMFALCVISLHDKIAQLKKEKINITEQFQDEKFQIIEKYQEENKQVITELQCIKSGNISEGDKLFHMALTQSLSEPLKYSTLEKCVTEYKHPQAAAILGGFYEDGIEIDEKILCEKNIEKAADLYKKCCDSDSDSFGLNQWLLGWIYEKKLIKEAKEMVNNTHNKTAFSFYNKSAENGFAKGYNSLGKFYQFGLHDENEKDFSKALKNYEIGREKGDVYAILNCGHLYKERYEFTLKNNENEAFHNLDQAVERYNEARKQESNEAYMQLAMIYEMNLIKYGKEPFDVADYYIKSASVKNQYGATALYKLGEWLLKNDYLQKNEKITNKLNHDTINDPVIICYINSYTIFSNLIAQNKVEDEYMEYYKKLLKKFKN